jgi:hypothetical protein
MCQNIAVSTLTYVYADSTIVLGPLATFAEPHCYDMCESHSKRLVPPRGWELVKLATDPEALKPSAADLDSLAESVRRAAASDSSSASSPSFEEEVTRGHLRVVRDAE